MGTQTQKQRKCCYHNLNAKQLMPLEAEKKQRPTNQKVGRSNGERENQK